MMLILLQVGACVVSPCKQVMSVGYNAYPEDMIDAQENPDKENFGHS